jgi:hypothetical protein
VGAKNDTARRRPLDRGLSPGGAHVVHSQRLNRNVPNGRPVPRNSNENGRFAELANAAVEVVSQAGSFAAGALAYLAAGVSVGAGIGFFAIGFFIM